MRDLEFCQRISYKKGFLDDPRVMANRLAVRVGTHLGHGMAVASDGKSHDAEHIPGYVTYISYWATN
jgi:hypothetical protein